MAANFSRIYNREYFSGAQAALYIGDVYVDEIVSYAFTAQQVKTPIYGYASQLFDATSAGPFIVQGNFSINFKKAGYIYLILQRYFALANAVNDQLNQAGNPSNTVQNFTSGLGLNAAPRKQPRLPTPFLNDTQKVMRANISQLIQGNLTTEQMQSFAQDLSSLANNAGLNSQFLDITTALEETVWGVGTLANSTQAGLNPVDDSLIRRIDDNYFDGFDMYFTYGDWNNANTAHTVERITGVRLTGRSKAVTISGEPIQEEYQFLARSHY